MRKILFIASHLCSGSYGLHEILNQNPRIELIFTNRQYLEIDDLDDLVKINHKCKNAAAIYGDHLLYNPSFANKNFLKFCKFIYVIRSAKQTLNEMCVAGLFTPERAVRYYRHRLQRIAQMSRRTPGAVLLTFDNLAAGKGCNLIEGYLQLKDKLEMDASRFFDQGLDWIPGEFVEEGQEAYEKYLYQMRQQDLLVI